MTKVKGHGPEQPEIMIVADYPTKEELANGKALDGSGGRLVANYLKENNYSIDKCYKTSFIRTEFSYPKNNKKRKEALEAAAKGYLPGNFRKELAQEILDLQPSVIISLGELPTQYLVNKYQIDKVRGSVFPLADNVIMDTGDPSKLRPNIRVVPAFSPRDIYAKWQRNFYATIDIGRAVAVRTRRDAITEKSLLWIVRSAGDLITWWTNRGYKSKFLTLDIETFNGFITCISFCGDGYEALSVPLVDKGMSAVDRALILKTVSQILRSPIPKVNQNIKYDHHILEYWGFCLEMVAGDTMLLGHCLYPELPKGLDFYTSIYTDFAYYKDEGRDFNPKQGWDVLFLYNAKDSLTAWQIYEAQINEAKEVGIWDFYQQKVWPCYHVYKKADDRGIRIDETEKNLLNVKYEEMMEVRHDNLKKLTGKPDINFNSPKQIATMLYDEFELPKQFKRNAEGNKVLTTDEETIEELILNYAKTEEIRDVLWAVIWCRKIYKILNYINVAYDAEEGRIHSWSKLTGTKSGRTSWSETLDKLYYRNVPEHPWYDKNKKSFKYLSKELGLSLQTLPVHGFEIGTVAIGRDLRKMYVPTPGYTFVNGDGGQAEARVVAMISEDWAALDEMERKSFRRNKHGLKDDLHTKTAMLVLQKLFDDITESDRQDFGKKPRHAGNYDMGPGRLSLMAHISFQRAIAALSKFHSISPKIREIFHTTVRTLVTNTRLLSTLHGRRRQFFDKLTSETYKQAFSYYPQAVVSDHIKFDTLVPLMTEMGDHAFFLSESHDSLFFEVKKDHVEPFCHRFKELEETPLVFNQGSFIRNRQLVIPLEVKISETNWHDLKEFKLG